MLSLNQKIKAMNTTENNKLIAEFMGWNLHVDDGAIQLYKNNNRVKHIGDLKYNSSWDKLMPVVEKIEGLGHGVTIYKKGCHINNETAFTTNGFNHSSKIEQTYKAVVEFIKWYNENKNK